MWMGRERSVMRWEIRHSLLTDEIARLEQALAALPQGDGDAAAKSQRDELRRALAETRARLRSLGPSPRAKMG